MNMTELNAMSDADLDRKVATQVMGWTPHYWDGIICKLCDLVMPIEQQKKYECCNAPDGFSPSTDCNDCAAMRAEIEKQGKTWVFCYSLREMLKSITAQLSLPAGERLPASWFILHSSPRQQCIAALLAMEESV